MRMLLGVALLAQICTLGSAWKGDDGTLYVCVPTESWTPAPPEPVWRWLLRQEGIL